MSRKAFRKRSARLDRITDRRNNLFKNRIGFLFRQHGQPPQERQSGIDQRRQLTRKNHEHPRLDGFALKEWDVDFDFLAGTRGFRSFGCLALRRLAFIRNTFRKIARLP